MSEEKCKDCKYRFHFAYSYPCNECMKNVNRKLYEKDEEYNEDDDREQIDHLWNGED